MNYKCLILSLSILSSVARAGDTATLNHVLDFGAGISLEGHHLISLDFDGATLDTHANSNCKLSLPTLKNPRQISMGATIVDCEHVCALDDNGVSCWRGERLDRNRYAGPPLVVPQLFNPRQISTGGNFACALDDSGVKCWGPRFEANGPSRRPILRNPKQISTGRYDVCAIDDSGVKCWGLFWNYYLRGPVLRNPRQISVGAGNVCVLDDDGVKCWGGDEAIKKVPLLRNPKQVSAAEKHACALDDDGVKCWGEANDPILTPPPLEKPLLISVGEYGGCAVDSEGVKCWGVGKFPSRGIVAFQSSLTHLGVSLTHLGKVSYSYRRDFYQKSLHEVNKHSEGKTRVFIASAIAPVIENTETEYFSRKILPPYAKAMEKWKQQLSFNSIADIELTPEVYQVSLKLIRAGLEASRSYVGENQRAELEEFIVALGRLSASDDNEGRRALMDLLQQHDPLVQSLVLEPRTKGYGLMTLLITDYFTKK